MKRVVSLWTMLCFTYMECPSLIGGMWNGSVKDSGNQPYLQYASTCSTFIQAQLNTNQMLQKFEKITKRRNKIEPLAKIHHAKNIIS